MRKQRALASLTPEERQQLAEEVQKNPYEKVLERIRKPRPEGYGLANISIQPLQTLRDRKETLDMINRRIKDGLKLSLADVESISAGEPADLSDEAHQAIMEATRDLALSGDNSPT